MDWLPPVGAPNGLGIEPATEICALYWELNLRCFNHWAEPARVENWILNPLVSKIYKTLFWYDIWDKNKTKFWLTQESDIVLWNISFPDWWYLFTIGKYCQMTHLVAVVCLGALFKFCFWPCSWMFMVYYVHYHSYCGTWPAVVARGRVEHKPFSAWK